MIGKRFGRLVLIATTTRNNKKAWEAKCDCGNIITIRTLQLTRKRGTKSCGCLRSDVTRQRNKVRCHTRRIPTCHPDRKHYAKGLCCSCYDSSLRLKAEKKEKIVTCHPDKPYYAKGLCRKCYEENLKLRNPEYTEKQKHQYKVNKKANAREKNLRIYGLTSELETQIIAKQGGGCAICGNWSSKGRLAIDHNHITGKFRGFLCDGCNRGLGQLGDTIENLRKALTYLEEAENKYENFYRREFKSA